MKLMDQGLLDDLSAQARAHPRLRRHYNFHDTYQEPCQRLLNAVEPGSYVRPHRHLVVPKPEAFVLLRGQLAVVTFSEGGEIVQVALLTEGGPQFGVEIAAGNWHSVLSLATGTVFFETKPGPYQPLDDKDFAPWAPAEGSAVAVDYQRQLQERLGQALRGLG